MGFFALFCLYFMQARNSSFGTWVIKKQPVRPVFPDYHSVSYMTMDMYNLAITLYLINTVHGHTIFNEKIVIILTECFKQVSKSSFEHLLWNTYSCFSYCSNPSRLSFRISHSKDGVWFIFLVEICEHVFQCTTTYYNL